MMRWRFYCHSSTWFPSSQIVWAYENPGACAAHTLESSWHMLAMKRTQKKNSSRSAIKESHNIMLSCINLENVQVDCGVRYSSWR